MERTKKVKEVSEEIKDPELEAPEETKEENIEKEKEEEKSPEPEEKKEEVKEEVVQEEAKPEPEDNTPKPNRYKKVGGGSFRMGNKIIKPGQIFVAFPNDIPKAFRDMVVLVSGNVAWEEEKIKEIPVPPLKITKPVYEIKKREGSQWYDVYDLQGKKINEKGLTQEKAESLKKTLEQQ
jgi:hypothetical protein